MSRHTSLVVRLSLDEGVARDVFLRLLAVDRLVELFVSALLDVASSLLDHWLVVVSHVSGVVFLGLDEGVAFDCRLRLLTFLLRLEDFARAVLNVVCHYLSRRRYHLGVEVDCVAVLVDLSLLVDGAFEVFLRMSLLVGYLSLEDLAVRVHPLRGHFLSGLAIVVRHVTSAVCFCLDEDVALEVFLSLGSNVSHRILEVLVGLLDDQLSGHLLSSDVLDALCRHLSAVDGDAELVTLRLTSCTVGCLKCRRDGLRTDLGAFSVKLSCSLVREYEVDACLVWQTNVAVAAA